ncbi:Cytochrome P450 E-class group I [Klebsormidium nitens]|uniref:Cytochrome P450 E-class group I n=1 Tax=Klebsormidium nitens TaxID=105231 RepID=A0A1Y1IH66_KLENI|nr:Cytochrome P450 E-class group I [Klebsormidium nitens]|eukprot:GAQ90003.1 Cytochrome P450 E-class group I [Klebsormidium nitens]
MDDFAPLSEGHENSGDPSRPNALARLHLLVQRALVYHALGRMAKRYGSVFSFWLGPQLAVYVSSYEAIKEVLVTKHKEFASRPPLPERISLTLHPKSIFATRRLAILHLLSTKAVKASVSIRFEETELLIEHLKRESEKNGGIIEPRDRIFRANLNTMMRPLFGVRFPARDEPGFTDAREALYQSLQRSFRQMGDFDWGTILPVLSVFANRDVRKTTSFRDGELLALIEEHRSARAKAGTDFVARDLVDTLLEIQEKEELENNDIIAILVDFLNACELAQSLSALSRDCVLWQSARLTLYAAVDTSGVSIEWTLAELTRRPAMRRRVQEEIDAVVGRGRPVGEDDLQNLPYFLAEYSLVSVFFKGGLDLKRGTALGRGWPVGEEDLQDLPYLLASMNLTQCSRMALDGPWCQSRRAVSGGADVHRGRPVRVNELEDLPHFAAVIKEHFRYRSIGPFLGPHMNDRETTISGYRIPAQTLIVAHTRGLSRDSTVFERAEEFLPERFLTEDIDITGKDIRVAPFGAGRRGCPGILQGLTVVQLAVARIAQTFDFELIDGEDIDMTERDWGLQVSLRTPLKARFTVRRQEHENTDPARQHME